ncbi:MAG: hypothetical protein Q4P15_07500 [Propionibacteriaceae bacterium]|nr:hypothetical protein [Propionibacteriaceae bacterium]
MESFPPPPDDETAEQAAIREGWMNYWKVYDKFTADPFVTDFTETQLVTVSGSDQARVILDVLQRLREGGWKVVGSHIFRDYRVLEGPSDSGDVSTAIVSYCYDGRQKRLVDALTGADVETTAADTYVETAKLEKGLDGIWRVSLIGNEALTC